MCILLISLATLAEVFQCFSLSCKANARVQFAKTGHGQCVICVVLLLIVMFCVLFMCKCVLPPGVNPIAGDSFSHVLQNPVRNPARDVSQLA
jgi:hypothetical protein